MSVTLNLPGMAKIANISLCDIALERATSRTSGLPGMVCFYGPSGYGKSVSAAWIANHRDAYYVQARSLWTKKHTLQAIADAMEMKYDRRMTVPALADAIAGELAGSGRPLIIDEMDHLVANNSVELVRDIYEACQGSIMLIGEEMLPTKLKKHERFHGRILNWVPAQPVSMADALELVPIYCKDVVISEDLLEHVVALANGSVRRVVVNLELIRDSALTLGRDSMNRSTWGSRELYTGEPAKARRQ